MFVVVEPGKLIGSIGLLLGAAPVSSLVVMLLRGEIAMGVARVDRKDAGESLGQLAALVARQGAEAVAAVFVDAAGAVCPVCAVEFEGVSRDLGAALQGAGVPLVASFVVDRVEQGGRWFDLGDRSVTGVLDDPASSMVGAAVAASEGRLVGAVEDAAALVKVDTARVAVLGGLLTGRRSMGVVAPDTGVRFVVAAVQRLAAGTTRGDGELAAGRTLGDGELAWLGALLVDPAVRDELYALVESDLADSARRLWELLSRVLPLPYRSEALVLLSFASYAAGDLVVAAVAAESVLADDPEHQMAGWLKEALATGIAPQALRGLIVKKTPTPSSA